MIVPEYWAEGRAQHRARNKQVTIRRFGWSDTSQADAQTAADARVAEALARHLAGESVRRRDRKLTYNGAEGLPIREEVLERHGSAVITRNIYGARCLNVPEVLFADVDFAIGKPVLPAAVRYALVVAAICAGGYWYHWKVAVLVGVVAWLAGYAISKLLTAARDRTQGVPEAGARAKIDRFVASHAEWLVRMYRTPAGLRLLALHRLFDPTEPAVREFFEAIGVDKVYARMCENQHCFRARLSGKPWRVGMTGHLTPRPGVWPIKPEHLPRRASWVAEYERLAAGYAACRYLETLGNGGVNAEADRIRELHDEMTRATEALPMA